jgi:hypothetical protein
MVEAETPVPQTPPIVDESASTVGQMSQWELMRCALAAINWPRLARSVDHYVHPGLLGPFLAPNEYMTNNYDYTYGAPSKITFIGPDAASACSRTWYP